MIGISIQNVLLIGENLGGCASISGSLLGENTGCQCVCCQEIDILEKMICLLSMCIVFIDVLGSFPALGVLIANRQMSGLVFI